MRIHDEKSEDGGTAWVKSAEGNACVDYSRSNAESPLSLWCSVHKNSETRIALALIEALCARETPTVMVIQSDRTETRFTPKVGRLFRCWTYGHQSVMAEAFSSRDMFNRVCSLSYAMQHTDLVRVQNSEIQLYEYRSVLAEIRKQTSPFEFLNIKEECDYTVKSASARCVDRITSAAFSVLNELPQSHRRNFENALSGISAKQVSERGYDTRYSYIQELTTAVILPAVVKFGSAHPFTAAVFKVFTETAGEYVSVCEEFLLEWGQNKKTDS